MTLQEALKIAEANKDALKLKRIKEYHDRYVFEYGNENDEPLILSGPLYVMKNTGEVNVFFPPDYDSDYLDSGIDIPIPQE